MVWRRILLARASSLWTESGSGWGGDALCREVRGSCRESANRASCSSRRWLEELLEGQQKILILETKPTHAWFPLECEQVLGFSTKQKYTRSNSRLAPRKSEATYRSICQSKHHGKRVCSNLDLDLHPCWENTLSLKPTVRVSHFHASSNNNMNRESSIFAWTLTMLALAGDYPFPFVYNEHICAKVGDIIEEHQCLHEWIIHVAKTTECSSTDGERVSVPGIRHTKERGNGCEFPPEQHGSIATVTGCHRNFGPFHSLFLSTKTIHQSQVNRLLMASSNRTHLFDGHASSIVHVLELFVLKRSKDSRGSFQSEQFCHENKCHVLRMYRA